MRKTTNGGRSWSAPPKFARLLCIGLVTFTGLLVACGSDDDDGDATGAAPTATIAAASEPEATSTPAAAAFPLTVSHALGEVMIESQPERVVALGYSDIDTLISFGITPVGIRCYPSESGIPPWLDGLLDPNETTLLDVPSAELPLEEIISLDPDLILGAGNVLVEGSYEELSQIAPTVVWQTGQSTDGLEDRLDNLALALGKSGQVEELLGDLDAAVEEIKAEHPDLEGTTYTYSMVLNETVALIHSPTAYVNWLLQQLGIVIPEDIAGIEPEVPPGGFSRVGLEQLNMIDADAVFVAHTGQGASEWLEGQEVFQSLPAVSAGHYAGLPNDVTQATASPSVLSAIWVLERFSDALTEAGY